MFYYLCSRYLGFVQLQKLYESGSSYFHAAIRESLFSFIHKQGSFCPGVPNQYLKERKNDEEHILLFTLTSLLISSQGMKIQIHGWPLCS